MNLKKFAVSLVLGAGAMTIYEAMFFGVHWFPKSEMEFMADFICILVFLLGFSILYALGELRRKS